MDAEAAQGKGMTLAELQALPVTFSIETGGRAWNMGRTKVRGLYRTDPECLPFRVKKVGRDILVTKVNLFASLGLNLDGTPVTAGKEAVAL